MRLVAGRVEFVYRPKIVVLLQGDSPTLWKVIRNARCRSEVEIFQAVIGRVENRVDDDVNGLEMPADYRPDLGRIPVLVPVLRVDAELEVGAIKKRPLVGA